MYSGKQSVNPPPPKIPNCLTNFTYFAHRPSLSTGWPIRFDLCSASALGFCHFKHSLLHNAALKALSQATSGHRWVQFSQSPPFLHTSNRNTSQHVVVATAGGHLSPYRVWLHLQRVFFLLFFIKIEKYTQAHKCSHAFWVTSAKHYACLWLPHSFFHRFTHYHPSFSSYIKGQDIFLYTLNSDCWTLRARSTNFTLKCVDRS